MAYPGKSVQRQAILPRWLERLSNLLTALVGRWQPGPEVVLIGSALVVGLLGGLGAVVFRYLIALMAWIGYEWIPGLTSQWGTAYVVFVPAVGGLIVGSIVYLFAQEAKGHGVPEVMEAVALRGGRIRPIVAVAKALASAVCIGSGGSAGREGPIVQIGSSIGSTLGQVLRLSDERVRNLVACGAAAGIASTFNTPIAGAMFALEIILGEFGVRHLSSVVVAAVAASVVGRAAFGDVAAFPIRSAYSVGHVWEYAAYVGLGVVAAATAYVFVRLLYGTEDVFDGWSGVPEWVKPACGGVLLGVLALAYPALTGATWQGIPQVYNVGYEVIEAVLENQYVLSVALVLLVVKILATSLTLGSGGSGGVFAPSLFMGAMLGSAYARGVNALFPAAHLTPGAFALVSMAAVFGAAAHAPITAILIVFELTGDYGLILPLMLTVVIATLPGQRLLGGESIYTLKLSRRGVRLRAGRDTDLLQGMLVGEVMTAEVDSVQTDTTTGELSEAIVRHRRLGFPVLDDAGKLWGIVTVQDLDRALGAGMPSRTTVAEIGTTWPQLQVAYPDETIGLVLTRMGARGIGRMPVVDREDPQRLLGVIRRDDIVRAYNMAMSRRDETELRVKRMKLRDVDGTDFVEFRLTEHDGAVGRSLRDVVAGRSPEWVLVSVNRHGQILFPHGNTVLQAGDLVTAFVRNEDATTLRDLFRKPPQPAGPSNAPAEESGG